MTRKRFEELVDEKGFNKAMLELQEKRNDIVNYEELKDIAIHEIADD